MKYFKSLICILLVAILLSGCTFRLASSVNDLISAVSPFGDNANIKKALDDFVLTKYSLKSPSAGEYITSYNFYDVDSDGKDEAIAFYESNDQLGTVKMALLKQGDKDWSVIASADGIGEAVYKLDFCDINNDGNIDILVCWDTISNSTSHSFLAYNIESSNDGFLFSQIGDSKSINNYTIVDFENDNDNEIIFFEISSGTVNSSKARLYSLDNNSYNLLSETKLDSRVISYDNIEKEYVDGDLRIYADAIGSSGDTKLTEIIYYSNSYDGIISPFYSYSTGITSGTSRNCLINSMDINDDSYIEVPIDADISTPSNVFPLDWKVYKNTILIHTAYSLYVSNDNYTIVIPDDYFENVDVSYDSDNRELVIKNNDDILFSIKPILKALYDKDEYSDYSIIMENSGYYYLAKSNSSDFAVDTLKENIKAC